MRLMEHILDLFFPPKCVFCRTLSGGEGLLCGKCQKTLPWTVGKEGETGGEFFSLCLSPLRYQGAVREAVHRYKFSAMRSYHKLFASLMAQCAHDRLSKPCEIVAWVPVSRRRKRQRGYDQSELLARGVAKQLDLPVAALLKKTRHTPAQSGIEQASQRRANVLGAYQVLDTGNFAGHRILLVDDVVTTGSTLSECSRALLTAGAKEVICVTLAKAERSRK